MAAPVGVTRSPGMPSSSRKANPSRSSAAAGAGNGSGPCAERTVPDPSGSGRQCQEAPSRRSIAMAAPTRSACVSQSASSWKCTRSIATPWTAASASRKKLQHARARAARTAAGMARLADAIAEGLVAVRSAATASRLNSSPAQGRPPLATLRRSTPRIPREGFRAWQRGPASASSGQASSTPARNMSPLMPPIGSRMMVAGRDSMPVMPRHIWG